MERLRLLGFPKRKSHGTQCQSISPFATKANYVIAREEQPHFQTILAAREAQCAGARERLIPAG